jgi:hypothetical protein
MCSQYVGTLTFMWVPLLFWPIASTHELDTIICKFVGFPRSARDQPFFNSISTNLATSFSVSKTPLP